MKKIAFLLTLTGIALLASSCKINKPTTGEIIMPDFKNETKGIVAVFDNGDVMLLNEVEGAIILSGDMNFSGLNNGDELTIYYDDLEETFPSRTIVKEMMLNSKGDVSRIPNEILENLKALGWNLKD